MVLFSSLWFEPGSIQTTVPYSTVKQMIRDGQVTSADLQEHAIVVTTGEPGAADAEVFRAVTPSQGDPDLLPLLEEQGVEITAEEPSRRLDPVLYPAVDLILGVLSLAAAADDGQHRRRAGRRGRRASGRAFCQTRRDDAKRSPSTMSRGRIRPSGKWPNWSISCASPSALNGSAPRCRMACCWSARRAPARRCWPRRWRARPMCRSFPPPGSEFIEIFVGVGAGRVRKMFEAARKAAPVDHLHRRAGQHRAHPGHRPWRRP